ncbi:GNAT family N-acetyltransferase [Kitasatospora sp. LaBMicrA B282]|uniref:GNAT family N-acetyltransferase n=1 Tax=Kitasatospora sp. LaBMicrA B282 TaxID=3420949 RepID=UPI003D143B3D
MSGTPIPTDARPEVRIGPTDVGRRVSVRRIEAAPDPATGRASFRDAIGVLTSWNDQELIVVARDGSEVCIPANRLVAGKPVPRFPARRAPLPTAAPAELQRIAARGWPAVEEQPLGDWRLRAAAGFTRRANSVQTLGDPGLPLPEALDRVRRWYAERDLPAHVEVTEPGSPADLARALERLGGQAAATLFRTAPLAGPARAGRPDAVERVRLSRTAGPGWLSVYRRSSGDPTMDEAAHRVLHGGPSVWFASVPDPAGAVPLAIGRCVVDGAWAGFAAIEVRPEARRQGLATALMGALAARAAEEGAQGAYLQVEAENSGARELYDGLGFTTSHTYHYVRLPQGQPSA